MNCRLQIVRVQIVAATCLLWPAVAHAQLSAPSEAAQIEFGQVSLYPTVQLVDAGLDSNVFNESQNPKEDYTFTLASRVLAVAKLGLNELMASAGSDYLWFHQYTQERSSSALYKVRFNLSASQFKPFVGGEHSLIYTRPSVEIDTRARRVERNVVAGSNFNLTDRTAITASATVSDATYDEGETYNGVDLKQELDRQERSYMGGVRYALTPLTTMVMGVTYGESRFLDHARDAKTYRIAPSFEFSPDAGIRGRAMVGVERFAPENSAYGDFTGLVFSAAVNWTLWGHTGFDVQANRDISYSYKDTEPYYLLTSGRLGLNQKFFGPVDLSGAVERQYLSYRFQAGVVPGPDFEPDHTVRDVVMAGFGVTLGRGFKVGLSGEHEVRRAPSDPQTNYTRTRLLSTVTIGY